MVTQNHEVLFTYRLHQISIQDPQFQLIQFHRIMNRNVEYEEQRRSYSNTCFNYNRNSYFIVLHQPKFYKFQRNIMKLFQPELPQCDLQTFVY
ncbi:unnamed protein product (macronuclear) [Paramecium tetraurelia]|uniref:Uncharacterized protein n=1 Tax=Paramecium tetraurelia TaxID=5888 RepID=A0BYQ8_PARTE|nr:uncharacterized protein GSPATT00033528001 [Paramecium tetraurelia]CAK63675.1 unnamed protein product [Paramecium tetraurelia]|eukprot:XP_001431073.1 hypothetical protein (macronuclear) [Paramecium tetraurelia strain d4-2]